MYAVCMLCTYRVRDLILIHPECPARGIVRRARFDPDSAIYARDIENGKYVRGDLQREKPAIKADNVNEKKRRNLLRRRMERIFSCFAIV